MKDKYIIVKYLRLSHYDGDKEESYSITNQRDLIDAHIQELFSGRQKEVIEIADDGYTGTNMNRPGMKKLLILAETHNLNCIIVKDFSRFARDYITVGEYIEKKFPEWEIRFISVNDKYDSMDYSGITGGIDIALKNIACTMYSMDLSEKIKCTRQIQYKTGKFLSPYAFYGYIKDPRNKHHLIIDEYAAGIVGKMFNMRLNGMKMSEIAKVLNDNGVLSPAEYKKSLDSLCRNWNRVSEYKHWTASGVTSILRDERYIGKLIGNKHERIAVGDTRVKAAKPEDVIVVENTHEPIISEELFRAVRAMSDNIGKNKPARFVLRGFVRCGCCRHRMTTSGTGANIRFRCAYKNLTEHNGCYKGTIPENVLADLLTDTIKSEINKAMNVSDVNKKLDNKIVDIIRMIRDCEKKIQVQKKQMTDEYIRLTRGLISEEEFRSHRGEINAVIAEYEQQIKYLRCEEVKSRALSAQGIFDKYIGTEEINRDTVEELVKAIYVYDDDRIEIAWKFREPENVC